MGAGPSKNDGTSCTIYKVEYKNIISYVLGRDKDTLDQEFKLGETLRKKLDDIKPKVKRMVFESIDFLKDEYFGLEKAIHQLFATSSIKTISANKPRRSMEEQKSALVLSGYVSSLVLFGSMPYAEYVMLLMTMITVMVVLQTSQKPLSRVDDMLVEAAALAEDDDQYFNLTEFYNERREKSADSLLEGIDPAILVCSDGSLEKVVKMLENRGCLVTRCI